MIAEISIILGLAVDRQRNKSERHLNAPLPKRMPNSDVIVK